MFPYRVEDGEVGGGGGGGGGKKRVREMCAAVKVQAAWKGLCGRRKAEGLRRERSLREARRAMVDTKAAITIQVSIKCLACTK